MDVEETNVPVMEIAFPPFNKGFQDLSNLMTYCILLSKQDVVKRKLKKTKVIVEESKETLLEILHEIDHISFSMGAKNISISLKIDENHNKSLTQAETELSSILVRTSL